MEVCSFSVIFRVLVPCYHITGANTTEMAGFRKHKSFAGLFKGRRARDSVSRPETGAAEKRTRAVGQGADLFLHIKKGHPSFWLGCPFSIATKKAGSSAYALRAVRPFAYSSLPAAPVF